MGWWPFAERETRQDSSYTDALVQAIQQQAGGHVTAFPTATAALEACTGFVGRAFALAEVSGSATVQELLTPGMLRLIGRSLIRQGELVVLVRVDDNGRIVLLPADSHDITGDPDPDSWLYRVNVGGPSRTRTHVAVRASSVLHFTYATDAGRPWKGLGPITIASLAGRLSSETVGMLADEASGIRGNLITTPVDGEDPTVAQLKGDLPKLKGRTALVEGGDWDNPGGDRGKSWDKIRRN